MATTYLYDSEGRDRKVELSAETIANLNERCLLWIDVDASRPGELESLAELLKLDRTSINRLRRANVRPRLDNYGGYFQLTVYAEPLAQRSAPPRDEKGRRIHGAGAVRLDLLVGDRWIVTAHGSDVRFLEGYRAQDKAETMIGALSPQALAASLLDWHLEDYFDAVAEIEAAVDRLDEQVIARPGGPGMLKRMAALKRQVSRLRALLAAQRAVFYGLARPDFAQVAESAAAPHFQTLAARFERAVDEVERTRDLVLGSFDLFTSRTTQQTNDLVKALTFITVAIGLCAAIAGVFGMNFETGFFATGNAGFYVTIAAQVLILVAAATYVRWRRWL
jgi:magnesium transporter